MGNKQLWVCLECGIKYGKSSVRIGSCMIQTCAICGRREPCAKAEEFGIKWIRKGWIKKERV